MSFENVKVVVTGGAKGIGLGIAKRFTKEGATVIISDQNTKLGTEVSKTFNSISFNYSYRYRN